MGGMIVGLVMVLCILAAFLAGVVAGMLHMRKNYKAELDQARRLTRAAMRRGASFWQD